MVNQGGGTTKVVDERMKAEMMRDLKNHSITEKKGVDTIYNLKDDFHEPYRDKARPFLMNQQLSTTSKQS